MKFINRYILLALAFVAPFFAMEKKPGLCGDQYYQDWSERVEESRKKFEIYLKQKEAKKDTKRREKEEISLNNVVPQYMEPQKMVPVHVHSISFMDMLRGLISKASE